MLIRKEKTEKNGLLGIWEMTESPNEILAMMPPELRSQSEKHIAKLHVQRRIMERLCARLLLFVLLNEEKEIAYTVDGSPYLTDNSYQISISHTNKYVAVLLHKTHSVGIDIETISERINKVAYKFISDEECIDESKPTIHRLLHWSAKESLFKVTPEKEIDFKQHLLIAPFTPNAAGKMCACITKISPQKKLDVHYEIHDTYVLTWVIA